jgi:PAS domain S-box-containing protein
MNTIELSDFFELTPDLVWIAGKDGFLQHVNHAVIEKLGYTAEELYASPISTFMYPEDVEETLLRRAQLFKGEVLHNYFNRYVTKTGNILWLEWTSVYIADKEIILAIAKDITARKKIEQEAEEQYNKFKGLATHFKSRIEKDRKYFAYELHEELAQLVSVVNMDVSWLKTYVADLPEKVNNRVAHASEVCRLLIKTIQRLAFSLSPQMMDDFGLNATLKWLCSEFTVLNGIACAFASDYDEQNIGDEMKTDIFRICQEALTNVLNYSQAGNIKIHIKDTGNNIELCISDSGNGFNTELEKQTTGFISIQKRAASINGTVTLHNKPGKGSGICIQIQKQNNPRNLKTMPV